jgi:hypothetical protein
VSGLGAPFVQGLRNNRLILDQACPRRVRRAVGWAFNLHTRYSELEASGLSMLRIETESDGSRIIVRLIGRVRFDCIEELRQRVQNQASQMVLDLAEVDLIDLQSVLFLRDCQDQKIELRNCAPYIHEWIRRERAEGLKRPPDRRNLSDR